METRGKFEFAEDNLVLGKGADNVTTLKINASHTTGAYTLYLPNLGAGDTLVGAATAATLTNKTLTSPTLTTPTLGVASATSINKVAFTAPATGSTLTIADGKTLTANSSLILAGTDATTLTLTTALTVNTGAVTLSGNAAGSSVTLPASGTLVASGAIANADVHASADIAYTKLAMSDSIVNADIKGNAAIALNKLAALTASRVPVVNGSGVLAASSVTATELGYVSGVTSALQTQLDAKEPTITAGTTAQYLRGDKSLSTFATDVAATSTVTANTAKVSAAGSIGSHSDVDVTTATPVTGNVLTYDGTNFVPGSGGAGSGEINYIGNPSAAGDISGWTSVGDLDVARTDTAAELPREFTAGTGIKITADANTQSAADYIYYDFTLDDVDLSKRLKLEFSQKVTGSLVAGDLEVVITTQADRTTALHTPRTSAIPASDGIFSTEFDASTTATLSLVIRATTDMATSAGIVISDVVVGPGKLHSGAVVTAWEAFTPTGSWTTNTTYTGWKRRVGDVAEYVMKAGLSGAPNTAGFTFNIPDGTIGTIGTSSRVGGALVYDGGTAANRTSGHVLAADGNSSVSILSNGSSTVTQASPFTWASGDVLIGTFSVPIEQWSGSGVLNTISQDNLSETTAYTPGAVSGFTSSSTAGTYSQRGDKAFITANAVFSADAGTLSWSATNLLPSGLTINESKMVLGTGDDKQIVGYGYLHNDNSAGTSPSISVAYDNSSNAFFFYSSSGVVTTTVPFAFEANDAISIQIEVPITEWAGSQSSLVGFTGATATQSGLVSSGWIDASKIAFGDSMTTGAPSLYSITANAAGASTCATLCGAVDLSTHALDSDSGACVLAWRSDTGAVLGSGCADTTSVNKSCMCAGVR